MLQPLTDDAIRNHLTGKLTVGVYPLIPDETCWFLAVDFDKKSWMADAARELGNSVFLDEVLQPCVDQWRFLESVHRFPSDMLARMIQEIAPSGNTIGVHVSFPEEERDEVPWLWRPSRKQRNGRITDPLPPSIRIVLSNRVYIEKRELPSAMLDRLIRIAALQNPEFYRAQAMRLSTYGKPRIISCGEDFPDHLGLPRGCVDEVLGVRTPLRGAELKWTTLYCMPCTVPSCPAYEPNSGSFPRAYQPKAARVESSRHCEAS